MPVSSLPVSRWPRALITPNLVSCTAGVWGVAHEQGNSLGTWPFPQGTLHASRAAGPMTGNPRQHAPGLPAPCMQVSASGVLGKHSWVSGAPGMRATPCTTETAPGRLSPKGCMQQHQGHEGGRVHRVRGFQCFRAGQARTTASWPESTSEGSALTVSLAASAGALRGLVRRPGGLGLLGFQICLCL